MSKLKDESEEVTVEQKKYKRIKHIMYKYRLKASKGSGKEVIVTASSPKKIMPGAKYSAEFAVEVVSEKYLYHLPLERIRRKMEAEGLKIFCKTLYSLCYFVSVYLESVVEDIKKEILEIGRTVHIDETPWPINNEKENKWLHVGDEPSRRKFLSFCRHEVSCYRQRVFRLL